jgi:hypothetical protein
MKTSEQILRDAVAKLIKAKGRFHTEQNYAELVRSFDATALAATEPDGESAPCNCEACKPNTWDDQRMILCATCGNKRCPHATDHRNACTNSNEPGQVGSSYGPTPIQIAGQVRDAALEEAAGLLDGKRQKIAGHLEKWSDSSGRTESIIGAIASLSEGIRAIKSVAPAATESAEASVDRIDAKRWRHVRNLTVEQAGMPGQPCIAMPNGMSSGYYLTEETADFAVDSSIYEAEFLSTSSAAKGHEL